MLQLATSYKARDLVRAMKIAESLRARETSILKALEKVGLSNPVKLKNYFANPSTVDTLGERTMYTALYDVLGKRLVKEVWRKDGHFYELSSLGLLVLRCLDNDAIPDPTSP